MEIFSESIKEDSKVKALIEILSNASEFEHIPIRAAEEGMLRRLNEQIQYKLEKFSFSETRTKSNILLQCHFSKIPLSSEFSYD